MGKKYIETSIEAFKSLQSKDLEQTYIGILSALSVIKVGTFEDIAKQMKAKPDKIWKRLSELHEKYMMIYRPGDKKTLKSGRGGFVWSLTDLGQETIGSSVYTLPGKTIADYSRAFNQPKQSAHSIERLF